jgi:hypothetical protein
MTQNVENKQEVINNFIKEHFKLNEPIKLEGGSTLGDIDHDPNWFNHCPVTCSLLIKDAIAKLKNDTEGNLYYILVSEARRLFDFFRRAYIINNQDEFNTAHCITIKIRDHLWTIGGYLHKGLEFYVAEGILSLYHHEKEISYMLGLYYAKDAITFGEVRVKTDDLINLIEELFGR